MMTRLGRAVINRPVLLTTLLTVGWLSAALSGLPDGADVSFTAAYGAVLRFGAVIGVVTVGPVLVRLAIRSAGPVLWACRAGLLAVPVAVYFRSDLTPVEAIALAVFLAAMAAGAIMLRAVSPAVLAPSLLLPIGLAGVLGLCSDAFHKSAPLLLLAGCAVFFHGVYAAAEGLQERLVDGLVDRPGDRFATALLRVTLAVVIFGPAFLRVESLSIVRAVSGVVSLGVAAVILPVAIDTLTRLRLARAGEANTIAAVGWRRIRAVYAGPLAPALLLLIAIASLFAVALGAASSLADAGTAITIALVFGMVTLSFFGALAIAILLLPLALVVNLLFGLEAGAQFPLLMALLVLTIEPAIFMFRTLSTQTKFSTSLIDKLLPQSAGPILIRLGFFGVLLVLIGTVHPDLSRLWPAYAGSALFCLLVMPALLRTLARVAARL